MEMATAQRRTKSRARASSPLPAKRKNSGAPRAGDALSARWPKTLCDGFGSMAKSWNGRNRRTWRFHFEKSAAREIPRGVPHHAPDADFRGETRESLPRRLDYRRRLSRKRAGSGERRLRPLLAKGRCLRAVDPRPGRTFGFRRTARRRRAHLSWFAQWPDARTRREYPSRLSEDGAARDDQ